MRAIRFDGAGGHEVQRLEDVPDPDPTPDEVLVRVGYAGLNPADLHQRAGRYPAPYGSPPDIPGLEVCGRVERCGARVRDWQAGDRVFGLVGGGGLAELVAVHERHVARVPDGLDEQVAAAAPEACITAHDAVFVQCGLRMGETLLVHGAAGGVGSAGLQLALAGGARAIGVARSDETRALVGELGAEAIAEEGFADAVLERTRGRGADVILELVGAPHFPDNLRALAPRGRIAVVGTGGGTDASLPLGALMGKRATVRGTMLRARPLEEKAAAVRAFEREVVPQLAVGRVRVPIDSVFAAEQHVEAYDRLAASGKRGKVLIAF